MTSYGLGTPPIKITVSDFKILFQPGGQFQPVDINNMFLYIQVQMILQDVGCS